MNTKLTQSTLYISLILLLSIIIGCTSSPETKNSSEDDIALIEKDTLEEVSHELIDRVTAEILNHPDSAELYIERSIIHEKLLNGRSAITDMQYALMKDSMNADYWMRLSALFLNEKNIIYSIDALRRGQEKNREHIGLNLELAKVYLYSGDLIRSVKFANTALKLDVTNPEIYFYKALAIRERGDTLTAISNLQTATEQNPDFYDAYMQLGLLAEGHFNDLVPGYFNNAIRIDSMSTEARFALGSFYQNNGQPEKAKEVFRELLKVDAMYHYAFYNIGYIYFHQDSLDQAYKNFDIATKVKPTYANAYYMRGLTNEAKGNKENAERDYQLTLNLDPDFSMARKGLERLAN